jgi:hypothetical protein
MFTLLGPQAHTLVAEWGSDELLLLPENGHTVVSFNGTPVIAVKSSGLGTHVAGWPFIVDETAAADFWRKAALKVWPDLINSSSSMCPSAPVSPVGLPAGRGRLPAPLCVRVDIVPPIYAAPM